MRLAVVIAVLALVAVPAADAHIPFKDGKRTAQGLQRLMNASKDFSDTRCRYRNRHVFCNGLVRWERSTFTGVRITFHKTAPRRGYAMICVKFFPVCKKDPVRYSR